MSLYMVINLGSLAIPLLFSFHPKIRFYERFPTLFPAIAISACVYLIWDIPFTARGVWGFNDTYLMGVFLGGLPLEEWLFFLCIPFSSVFTHYTLSKLTNYELNRKAVDYISIVLLILLALAAVIFFDRSYTFVNALCALLILLLAYIMSPQTLQRFYLTFPVILIPFFIVNGLLTGSWIVDEVVWYNNSENLGIRLGTIPLEDVFYAFGLILCSIFLMDRWSRRKKS